MHNFTFVTIGPLKIDDLSAVQPDIIQGYPSATAVAGLGYKIVLNLIRHFDVEGLKHEGTAVIVHEHSELDGHPKNPVMDKKIDKGAPIVDEFRARAEMSFVVAISGLEIHDNAVATAINDMLPSLFFSGGKIFPTSFDVNKQVSICSGSKLKGVLRKLKPGSVLFDRHDLLDSEIASGNGEVDTLDALLNCLEFKAVPLIEDSVDENTENSNKSGKNKASDNSDKMRKYPGWLVPLFVGFQGIENRQKRSHTRTLDGLNDHIYAESLYSIGEYKSLTSVLASEEDDFLEGSFWKHAQNKASETFFVTANS